MIELKGKYATAKIFAETVEEGVYQQVYDIINCRTFDGQKVACMPDVHVGASGPCGLVATIGDYVCPEHIGVDIGCSISMLVLDKCLPNDKYADFEHKVKTQIPFGMNIHNKTIFDEKDFYKYLTKAFCVYKNRWPEMLSGLPEVVSEKWVIEQLKRLNMDSVVFYHSIGTVGGGNHFIEYGETEDKKHSGVTLHFGSRNFGVKVCKYWMSKTTTPYPKQKMKELVNKFKDEYKSSHKDMSEFKNALSEYQESVMKNHITGYLTGENLKGYLMDMCFAQMYASYNHKVTGDIISGILNKYGIKVTEAVKTTHNYIDLNDHVLRKSAISAYKGIKILVPFNMRDGVAVCVGKENGEWLNSCSHGAGRRMSRSQAKREVSMSDFKESMKGVYSTTVCEGTLDESPQAYKDTQEIKDLITETCDILYVVKSKINIKAVE